MRSMKWVSWVRSEDWMVCFSPLFLRTVATVQVLYLQRIQYIDEAARSCHDAAQATFVYLRRFGDDQSVSAGWAIEFEVWGFNTDRHSFFFLTVGVASSSTGWTSLKKMLTYDILMLEICYDWDFSNFRRSRSPNKFQNNADRPGCPILLRSRNRLNLNTGCTAYARENRG